MHVVVVVVEEEEQEQKQEKEEEEEEKEEEGLQQIIILDTRINPFPHVYSSKITILRHTGCMRTTQCLGMGN